MLAVIALLSAVALAKVYQVSDFQGQIFKFNNMASGIYQVNIGLDDFTGFLVAYADVNNDKS
jgi:hypothetical protein